MSEEQQIPEGLTYYRVLDDGRAVGVTPLLFGAAIITIGRAYALTYTHDWMYSAEVGGERAAIEAAKTWNPATEDEPQGWIRTDFKATSGYRRRPGGDPSQEYETN